MSALRRRIVAATAAIVIVGTAAPVQSVPPRQEPIVIVETRVKVKRVFTSLGSPVPLPAPGRQLVKHSPGCRLRRGAVESLRFVEAILGKRIPMVSCWRSRAQQVALFLAKGPSIAAQPGSSKHEDGLAIDVNTGFLARHPRVRRLLNVFGWHQFAPSWEPWHFSYRTVG